MNGWLNLQEYSQKVKHKCSLRRGGLQKEGNSRLSEIIGVK